MTVREHADRTESLLGHRAQDIHRWIDRFFDAEGFADFLRGGYRPGYDPYAHRRHRHCREAIPEALEEFRGLYPPEIIEAVVERHIRDDYDGYLPYREDFEKGDFREKYHESENRPTEMPDAEDLATYFRGKHYEGLSRTGRGGNTRFLWRFMLPVLVALTLLIGSLFAVIVPLTRENLVDLKKESIRELTAVAVGALEHYAAHVPAGLMNEDEARFEAAEEIRRMRYGEQDKEYYWIIDSTPLMVMHPYRSELEGSDLSSYRDKEDAAGVYLFREAAELALVEGEGYISYYWQHWDDPSALAPKLSYVRYFPEWDWIVGTGIYINDVEEEIAQLTRRLGGVFGGISLLSVLLLVWVLAGALRIERNRDEAEAGLRETKERYRALAEASTEGYMLVAAGAALYANPALCRITGRSEENLLQNGPSGLLEEGEDNPSEATGALAALENGEAPSGNWTVRIAGPEGKGFEASLGISRIFLPDSNGHVVSVRRPYTAGDRIGLAVEGLEGKESTTGRETVPDRIGKAGSRVAVLENAGRLGEELTRLMHGGATATVLRRSVADVYDAVLSRMADLASPPELEKNGAAILSLGSNARREMTPFSDQDGAIIFREVLDIPIEENRIRWLNIARDMADGLEDAGFPRCDGGVMPMNPRWCLSEGEWQARFGEWIDNPTPQAMLEMNVVLDNRFSWGNRELGDSLQQMIDTLAERSPGLLLTFEKNAALYRPPAPSRRMKNPVDMKEALKPLETQVRVLALVHGLHVPGTLERLDALGTAGVLSRNRVIDLKTAFETLWRLRFLRQIEGHRSLVRSNDAVDPAVLSAVEKAHLMAALDAVDGFVKRRMMEAGSL